MASNPVPRADDLIRIDAKGRPHRLRFCDGYAIIFWIDHSAEEVRVMDVGFG